MLRIARKRAPRLSGELLREPQILLALLLFLLPTATISAQGLQRAGLDAKQATKLAELMCRQLPNLTTIPDSIEIEGIKVDPSRESLVEDDVYDTLLRLGPYSIPCLVDRVTDKEWMPDPRTEPLLGAPVVGDVAYLVLMGKGVDDILPNVAGKLEERTLGYYFVWSRADNHRQRLQSAVRAWLLKHQNCCAAPTFVRAAMPARAKFQMSATELAGACTRFSQLRPGMSRDQVLNIAGKPDAVDANSEGSDESKSTGLLSIGSTNRNEKLAYIYFTERWTDEVVRRDPLRDRYVILFFSEAGKFTRMFSNVAEIPPIFPHGRTTWLHLAWEDRIGKQ